MLKLDGVNAHYGLSHILQGIDIEVGDREVVGLFGRNGVGKTTTLRCIAGWLKPSGGAIHLDGEAIGGLSPDQIARRGVAFVPEDRRIFPGLTVEENLRLGLLQRGRVPGVEAADRVEAIYERFPRLAERRRQAGITLSGGEQQMLTIARAIVASPQLLLVDEPSEGLAPMIVEDIFRVIAEMREQGTAVLLVEQNVLRALDVVDRFYVVERGAIALTGVGDASADRERLFEAIAV